MNAEWEPKRDGDVGENVEGDKDEVKERSLLRERQKGETMEGLWWWKYDTSACTARCMEVANRVLSLQCQDGVSKDWDEWTIDVSPWKDPCDRDTMGRFARPEHGSC